MKDITASISGANSVLSFAAPTCDMMCRLMATPQQSPRVIPWLPHPTPLAQRLRLQAMSRARAQLQTLTLSMHSVQTQSMQSMQLTPPCPPLKPCKPPRYCPQPYDCALCCTTCHSMPAYTNTLLQVTPFHDIACMGMRW